MGYYESGLSDGGVSRSQSSEPYAALIRLLIAARKAAGLKQTELAERLVKPQSFVSKVERGERRLDAVELIIVMRAIGADETVLFAEIARSVPTEAKL